MQAIEVKFLGATNFQGSRLKAICQAGTITSGWRYELEDNENYEHVAKLLIKKLGWEFEPVGGVLPNGNHVFVLQKKEGK